MPFREVCGTWSLYAIFGLEANRAKKAITPKDDRLSVSIFEPRLWFVPILFGEAFVVSADTEDGIEIQLDYAKCRNLIDSQIVCLFHGISFF